MVSDEELAAHHCLELSDRVPGDPETTAFKRRARLQQALWRESKGLAIGTQPMRPKAGQSSRCLGSRIALDPARESGANFLHDGARSAVRHRITNPEPYQTIGEDRLFCDLLSSMPMCFNLFGSLHDDLEAADHAVHRWWQDAPGKVSAVRFEWSPGRRLPGEHLENRSAFDVAFELALADGRLGQVRAGPSGEEPQLCLGRQALPGASRGPIHFRGSHHRITAGRGRAVCRDDGGIREAIPLVGAQD